MKFITKKLHTQLFNSAWPLFLGLGICLSLLLGCKSQLQASQQEPVLPLLHFQKTACLGTCPAYEASISTDGIVTFMGHAHVPSTDTLTFKLSEEKLDSLKADIANLNYKALQDLYPTQWSDMPSTHITFYEHGKVVKKTKIMEGGPEALQLFHKNLDKVLLEMAAAEAHKSLPVR